MILVSKYKKVNIFNYEGESGGSFVQLFRVKVDSMTPNLNPSMCSDISDTL